MTRVKSGVQTKRRHKKVLKEASGYFGSKHRLYKTAKEQLMHSSVYAYRDRRQKKREFRKLWITRINAACRMNDISYSKFINGLTKAGVEVNRKMLSELAINDMDAFKTLVSVAKSGKVTEEVKKETVKNTEKDKKEEKSDLSSKTVAELREIAKEKEVEGYSTMKKAELINALK
ncbi:MAG: 50S ribosomal protein L20 [Bacilli bacterium]|nr:50S ribosomal protein L20 [Bacilli bacterium]